MNKLMKAMLIAGTFTVSAHAVAAAPMMKSQPGYYRLMVGKYEVTALSDGTAQLPADKLLQGIKPDELAALLRKSHLTSNVEGSINDFLVNTGEKLILIDAGTGGAMGADNGHLLQSLKNAGYNPAQVDEVLLTHMHVDHVGGLSNQGQRVFPNATVWVDKKDADFWLDKKRAAEAPEGMKGFFTGAMAAVAPYIAKGKFKTFNHNQELVSGISSVEEPGHSAGHNNFVIHNGNDKLVIIADLVHFAAVQFDRPDISVGFDVDAKASVEHREEVFKRFAKDNTLVAGSHLPFPGIGYINAEGNHFAWNPVNYGLAK